MSLSSWSYQYGAAPYVKSVPIVSITSPPYGVDPFAPRNHPACSSTAFTNVLTIAGTL